MTADGTTPYASVDHASAYSDCDALASFPVPPGGQIEGGVPYGDYCGGDCHFLVYQPCTQTLYESYNTQITAGSDQVLSTGCAIAWDLTRTYPANLRGDQCTSCDAAGYPVGALLWTADELAAGVINHAIRFILPNNRIQAGVYQHPATHGGCPAGSSSCNSNTNSIMYGTRLRLKPSFSLSSLTDPSPYSHVVVTALKTYGMFLADGGNIPLTAAADTFTTAKYANLPFDSHSLYGIAVTDFEVIDDSYLGQPVALTFDCVKNSFDEHPFIGPNTCGSDSPSTTESASESVSGGVSSTPTPTRSLCPSGQHQGTNGCVANASRSPSPVRSSASPSPAASRSTSPAASPAASPSTSPAASPAASSSPTPAGASPSAAASGTPAQSPPASTSNTPAESPAASATSTPAASSRPSASGSPAASATTSAAASASSTPAASPAASASSTPAASPAASASSTPAASPAASASGSAAASASSTPAAASPSAAASGTPAQSPPASESGTTAASATATAAASPSRSPCPSGYHMGVNGCEVNLSPSSSPAASASSTPAAASPSSSAVAASPTSTPAASRSRSPCPSGYHMGVSGCEVNLSPSSTPSITQCPSGFHRAGGNCQQNSPTPSPSKSNTQTPTTSKTRTLTPTTSKTHTATRSPKFRASQSPAAVPRTAPVVYPAQVSAYTIEVDSYSEAPTRIEITEVDYRIHGSEEWIVIWTAQDGVVLASATGDDVNFVVNGATYSFNVVTGSFLPVSAGASVVFEFNAVATLTFDSTVRSTSDLSDSFGNMVTVSNTNPSTAAATAPASSGPSVVVVGGSVGGAIGFIVVLGVVILTATLAYRRRRARTVQPSPDDADEEVALTSEDATKSAASKNEESDAGASLQLSSSATRLTTQPSGTTVSSMHSAARDGNTSVASAASAL